MLIRFYFRCLLAVGLAFIIQGDAIAQQQNIVVKGTVTTDAGAALANATVFLKSDSTRATLTSVNGEYQLEVPANGTLIFSAIGFARIERSIQGESVINATLTAQSTTIDEVVITAFGNKQRRSSMVSAVATINPEELKGPTSNLTTMMAGRVGGMIAYQRSGEPGADNAQFFIRGLGTFGTGKQDPLILIDGIESSNTDMARLQPDDIAAFSVLRDATASAVYGARGANGVVLITTKVGSAGKTKFTLRSEVTASSNTRNFEFADNITYMQLANEAALTRNPLAPLPYLQTKIDATARPDADPLLYPNNNWIEQLVKDYTINTRNNLSIAGGSDKARYYIAGTFNVDNGVLKAEKLNNFNSNVKLINYSVRSNVDLKLTRTTDAAVRVYAQFDDYKGPLLGSNGENGGSRIFRTAIWANPVMFPAIYPSSMAEFPTHPLFGNAIAPNGGLYVNPYAEMVKGYSEYNRSNVQAQIELKQNLNAITQGLNARLMSYVRRESYLSVSRNYNPYFYTTQLTDGEVTLLRLNGGGLGSIGTVGTEYLNFSAGSRDVLATFYTEAALNYDRAFGKHTVGGMLITTLRNYVSGNMSSLQLSLPARNQGLSGRFSYGYDSRYLAEFNFGYNGSERFAENSRFGFFPSFGLGYVVSNEKFFEPLTHVINNFKLRATYGFVGSDQIGNSADRFFYLSEVGMNNADYGATFGELYGYNRPGVLVSRYANPNITWEKSEQINLGMDLRLFKAWELNVDVYRNKRSNILSGRTYIPTTMGLQASIIANTNEGQSEGIDVMTTYNKDFGGGWSTQLRGNFTYATSKVLKYDEPTYGENEWFLSRVGNSMAQRYGYIAERLFVDDYEAMNSPIQFGGTPGVANGGSYGGGDIKYRDVNGDGVVDNRDQVAIGFPTSPEIIYGFGGTIAYKSFDLSLFFQGSARSSFFINSENIAPFVFNNGSQNALLQVIADSYWSEENRNLYATWPRLSQNFVNNNSRETVAGETSTWWMRNGSFLRFKKCGARV
ncbi:SusC/RagA family TonB-linked outer membrane protein [Niabella hibiscisoli]|uniref:SusC/RagA family TonB-linked outer membrane protein n=1 Tax=Niabella hibiscisoli TaxID=1825928 RepID=UPI001F0D1428|nr:TonB-dependent receptor [Niabella hibiscisoli]MCH5716463.1 TonB-dependent receptor [Niabella hibiscisoli]